MFFLVACRKICGQWGHLSQGFWDFVELNKGVCVPEWFFSVRFFCCWSPSICQDFGDALFWSKLPSLKLRAKTHWKLAVWRPKRKGIIFQTSTFRESNVCGFNRVFSFTPIIGEMIQFDARAYFSDGLVKHHQLGVNLMVNPCSLILDSRLESQHASNKLNYHHGKPMVNSPLIRPYFLGG